MAPLTPHWAQPSHPLVQEVIFTSTSAEEFTTKSISLIDLPPYGVFAKLAFPPCTHASSPTYATVQMGREEHLNLNSDLVYINHSCEPSVIFDTTSLLILAGANGLKAGQELTFFYPSTEWDMAQGFTCFCGTPSCKGYISGAKTMSAAGLAGSFLNAHIRELLEERDGLGKVADGVVVGLKAEPQNGNSEQKGTNGTDHTAVETEAENYTNGNADGSEKDTVVSALETSLAQARKLVASTQKALETYKSLHQISYSDDEGTSTSQKGSVRQNGVGSRELSGEMGGDTK